MNKPSRFSLLLSVSVLLLGTQAAYFAAAGEEPEQHPPPKAAAPAKAATPAPRPAAPAYRTAPTAQGRPAYSTGQVSSPGYSQTHYYPHVGAVSPTLPPNSHPYYHGSSRYYFTGGVWYAPQGPGFVVVRPPPGLVITVLPPYYSTVWLGGTPYYYADNVYYVQQPDQSGYSVVDAPDGAPAPPPDAQPDSTTDPQGAPQGGQSDLMVYPKNGQSQDQQSQDNFECNNWARGQTGFDPTQPGGGIPGNPDVNRSNYNRAMAACLQARGYQVN
jgi:hypothetical protein